MEMITHQYGHGSFDEYLGYTVKICQDRKLKGIRIPDSTVRMYKIMPTTHTDPVNLQETIAGPACQDALQESFMRILTETLVEVTGDGDMAKFEELGAVKDVDVDGVENTGAELTEDEIRANHEQQQEVHLLQNDKERHAREVEDFFHPPPAPPSIEFSSLALPPPATAEAITQQGPNAPANPLVTPRVGKKDWKHSSHTDDIWPFFMEGNADLGTWTYCKLCPPDHAIRNFIKMAWENQFMKMSLKMKALVGKISLMTDIWDDKSMWAYTGVTAHYIVRMRATASDSKGQLILKAYLVGFLPLPGKHCG
ncbi:hypothetical protein M422DRAFT_271539 [Sphaerobolus stellatus SS14]|uniref:Uncharacterized protein n=1 Tax=Sphaerobolus stellatus (strain SS14) TaxID=990650 RepID=A0A0C9UPB8_SPHS4|nr:hypothetical protein M422DRAFT_271539 [Sphaerobolus stellatus SS14]